MRSPAHSGTFQTRSDDVLARGFDFSGTNLPAVSNVVRVVHAVLIRTQVVDQQLMLCGHWRRTIRQVDCLQLLYQRQPAALLQMQAPLFHLLASFIFVGREDVRKFLQMFRSMPEVKNEQHLFRDSAHHVGQAVFQPLPPSDKPITTSACFRPTALHSFRNCCPISSRLIKPDTQRDSAQ